MTDEKRSYDNWFDAFTGVLNRSNKEEKIAISLTLLCMFAAGLLAGGI